MHNFPYSFRSGFVLDEHLCLLSFPDELRKKDGSPLVGGETMERFLGESHYELFQKALTHSPGFLTLQGTDPPFPEWMRSLYTVHYYENGSNQPSHYLCFILKRYGEPSDADGKEKPCDPKSPHLMDPLPLLLVDYRSGMIRHGNQRAQETLRLSGSELLGRHYCSLFVSEQLGACLESFGAAAPSRCQFPVIGKTEDRFGSETLLEIYTVGLESPELELNAVFFHDVSRVLADSPAPANHDLFMKITESIPVPIYFKNSKGLYIGGNRTLLNLLNLTGDRIENRCIAEILSTDLARLIEKKDRELHENGGVQVFDSHIDFPGLENRTFRFYRSLFQDSQHENGIVGVLVDITETVQARDSFKKINSILRTLAQVHRSILVERDETSLLETVSRIILEQRGYGGIWMAFPSGEGGTAPESIIHSRGFDDLLVEFIKNINEEEEDWSNPLLRTIHMQKPTVVNDLTLYSGSPELHEFSRKTGVNSLVTLPLMSDSILVGAMVILAEGKNTFNHEEIDLLNSLAGDLTHAILSLRIRSLHERAMREQERIQEQLIQAQKMEAIGALAGGIAHDFNNFLNIILGYTQLLMKRFETDPSVHGDLEEIDRATRKASRITGQLLLMGRSSTVVPRTLNINRVILDSLDLMKRTLDRIELKLELEQGLKSVNADPGQIEQIFMNLILNAKNALEKTGGVVTVFTNNRRVSLEEGPHYPGLLPGEFVVLTVADDGPGIAPEIRDRIFEPFFSTKENRHGTGLGLSVVYSLVHQHGGAIYLESEPDQGTRFDLFFPATDEAETGEIRNDLTESDPVGAGRGEWILLVEDNEDLREMNVRILEESGFRVVEAAGVQDALEMYKQSNRRFDLLFSDMMLPDGTGLFLSEVLRKLDPDIPVLLTSGYTGDDVLMEQIREQGFHFIQKPWDVMSLHKTIQTVMHRS